MKKTAVIYARVSTARQAAEELPIEGQLERCRKKAEEMGAVVMHEFVDAGLSGRAENRPEFQAMLSFCEAHEPDYLVTWSTSRLARNRLLAVVTKGHLERAGTQVVYVAMSIDSTTDSGWMTESMMEIFDEYFSRQVSKDTMRSMMKNAESGFFNGGTPPLGYRSAPSPKNHARRVLEIHPHEAEQVRDIFEMRLNGKGAKSIAEQLNTQCQTRRGSPWRKNAILSLLRNEAMVGRVVFNRKDSRTGKKRPRSEWVVVDAHKPLIDSGTWTAVQKIMDDESHPAANGSGTSTHLFTGLLRCGVCGGSMQIRTGTGRSKTYSYYACRNRVYNGTDCTMPSLPAQALDDYLIDVISSKVFKEENLRVVVLELMDAAGDWSIDHDRRVKGLERELGKATKKNDRIFEVMEELGKNTPNLHDLTRRLRGNNKEIKDIESRLADLEAELPPEVDITPDDVDELREVLTAAIKGKENPKKIRTFLRGFIKQIVVDDEHLTIRYYADRLTTPPPVRRKDRTVCNWLPRTGSNRRPSD